MTPGDREQLNAALSDLRFLGAMALTVGGEGGSIPGAWIECMGRLVHEKACEAIESLGVPDA